MSLVQVLFHVLLQLALSIPTSKGFFANVLETYVYPRSILLLNTNLQVNHGMKKFSCLPKLDFKLTKELGRYPELWIPSTPSFRSVLSTQSWFKTGERKLSAKLNCDVNG